MRITLAHVFLATCIGLASAKTCPTHEEKVARIVKLIRDNEGEDWCRDFLKLPEYATTESLESTQTVEEVAETVSTIIQSEDVEGEPTTTTSTSTAWETSISYLDQRTAETITVESTTTTSTFTPTRTTTTVTTAVVTVRSQAPARKKRKRNDDVLPTYLKGRRTAMVSSACSQVVVPKTLTVELYASETQTSTKTVVKTETQYNTIPRSTETVVPVETSITVIENSDPTTVATRTQTSLEISTAVTTTRIPTTTTVTSSATRTYTPHPAATDDARFVLNRREIVIGKLPGNSHQPYYMSLPRAANDHIECCSACQNYGVSGQGSCGFASFVPEKQYKCTIYISATVGYGSIMGSSICPAGGHQVLSLTWATAETYQGDAYHCLGPCVKNPSDASGNILGEFPLGIPSP